MAKLELDKFRYNGKKEGVESKEALRTRLRSKPGALKVEQKAKARALGKKPTFYHELEEIPDYLREGLKLVFCGFNPGIQSAKTGHRYAHVLNLFWRLLIEGGLFSPELPDLGDPTKTVIYSSGLSQKELLEAIKRLDVQNSDLYLFKEKSIGWTDLVSRPSKNIAELTSAEMDDGVPHLLAKFARYQPRVVCFVGKDIFSRIYKHVSKAKGKYIPSQYAKEFEWGTQNDKLYFASIKEWFDENGARVPVLFAIPSTSGLVGSIPRNVKLDLFKKLASYYDAS